MSSPAPCHLDDVTDALSTLTRHLDGWRKEVSSSGIVNPRILLLKRRSRVQFLLALRSRSLSTSRKLFPYVVQCFPTLLSQRMSISRALDTAIENIGEEQSVDYPAGQDLYVAKQLMDSIEACLLEETGCVGSEVSLDSENKETYEPTILNLQGLTASEIYSYHLSDMISQNYGPALPGLVLWCEHSTSEIDINNLLSVPRAPTLSRPVHVVGVDRLTRSMREILLKGIELVKLRAPMLLIFGDGEGIDTFAQYKLKVTPQLYNPSDLRQCLWASSLSLPSQTESNAAVWVIAGNTSA